MPKILQVNFTLTIPASEWEATAETLAPIFTNVRGLRWKVWLLNEKTSEAGGVYLFDSDEALNEFLNGPIPIDLQKAPFQRDLSVKVFDVMSNVTALTHGPVGTLEVAGAATA